jgi:hypothetical protein
MLDVLLSGLYADVGGIESAFSSRHHSHAQMASQATWGIKPT